MKKATIVLLFLVSCLIAKAQIETDSTLNTKLEFAVKLDFVLSTLKIKDINSASDLEANIATPKVLVLGVQYKGFGITYSPAGFYLGGSNGDRDMTELEGRSSAFGAHYYKSKWGGEYSFIKLGSFTKDYVGIDLDGFEREAFFELVGMEQKTHKFTIYRQLSGKYDLSDNFCSPIATRKSKFGTYAMASIESKKTTGLGNMWRERPEEAPSWTDYWWRTNYVEPDLFDMNNDFFRVLFGGGASGTLFLMKKMPLCYSVTLGFGYSKTKTYQTGVSDFSKGYFDTDVDGKFYFAYLGKRFRFEYGGGISMGSIILNDELTFEETLLYGDFKIVFLF